MNKIYIFGGSLGAKHCCKYWREYSEQKWPKNYWPKNFGPRGANVLVERHIN